jgi:hypothetical protein
MANMIQIGRLENPKGVPSNPVMTANSAKATPAKRRINVVDGATLRIRSSAAL